MQNVSEVLQPVRDRDRLCRWLLPYSKWDQLKAQHISEQENNMIATYYVQTSDWASWEHLAVWLYERDEQRAVEAVRNYWQAPRGTVVMDTK